MESFILCAWLFLPTAFANPAPVLASKLPFLKPLGLPLDGGLLFRGKRVFGDHKTLRGLISGIILGAFCGLLQYRLAMQFSSFASITDLVDYQSLSVVFYGAAIGAGAVFGDAIKSFFKRQIGIAPGDNWILFDQIDFIVGAILVSLFFYTLSFNQYLLAVALALVLHPTYNIISWMIGLQDKPF